MIEASPNQHQIIFRCPDPIDGRNPKRIFPQLGLKFILVFLNQSLHLFIQPMAVWQNACLYFGSSHGTLNPSAEIPGYSMTRLRLGIEDDGSDCSLDAYLKNALVEAYYV